MLPLQCHHPQTSLLCYQPPFTSFSMFINNFQPSLSHFSPFAPGQFVCHSLSALLQKLICNLFVLDQKFVLDQVVSQISTVLFNKCSAPLLCFVLHVCVCVCVCVFVAVSILCEFGRCISGADNAHSPRTPAHDMVETAQQPAGWWILDTGKKLPGFWGVNMYNILDFWKVDKEMVRETNIMR